MPFLIITAVFLFLLFLIAVVWTNLEVRQQPGYQPSKDVSPQGVNLSTLRGNPAINDILATNFGEMDEFALGRVVRMMETEHPPTITIDRKLWITFPISVYINHPFDLKVYIGDELGKKTPDTRNEKVVSPENETLRFPAHEEKPPVQVELQFAKEEFSANTTKQLKTLEKEDLTEFSFRVKPLKAEACNLTIAFSYVPKHVGPEQIEGASEQVEVVTIDKTSSSDQGPEKKEHEKQVTWKSTISAPLVVKTEQVEVEVKSLFGLNTAELTIWKSALGAVAALILLIIALVTKQTDGVNAVALVIGCAANAFGVPIYDGVTKLFGQKKQGG